MSTSARSGLTTSEGTALYVSALLGAGLLITPSLAARQAGPAALVSWTALLVLSAAIAATFGALGSRHPDAGGIATFVTAAFGPRASALVGYWFYFALPLGAPATALVGAGYVARALSAGTGAVMIAAFLLLGAALATNALGLRVSSRVQLGLAALLTVVIVIGCAVALPHARASSLDPFMTHGFSGVTSAAILLFFSFAGWEAVAHLSHEFRDPIRQIPRVTAITLAFITLLYLGLAATCTLVLGADLTHTTTPLTDILGYAVGPAAPWLTAAVAIVLTYGTMTAYLAGASRLGAALARDGWLPARLAGGHLSGEIPRASLSLLAILSLAVLAATSWSDRAVELLFLPALTLFIIVTCAGLYAGVRLLERPSLVWCAAVIASISMTGLLLAAGWGLVAPAAVALVLIVRWLTTRGPRPTSPLQAGAAL